MSRVLAVSFVVVTAVVSWSHAARARPTAPRAMCADARIGAGISTCQGTVPSCQVCHRGPPDLNDYGLAVVDALSADASYTFDNFDARVGAAITSIDADDADGDGVSNLEELLLGTMPGDATSHAAPAPAPDGEANTHYDVGHWDARFALRRVRTVFCGTPASYDEMTQLATLPADAQRDAVHAALSACLSSSYWKDEALHRIADPRVRPLESIGFDGLIPLADYTWDYRLFSHIMSDDRDVRDLLRADYHVDESGNVITGVIDAPTGSPLGTGGQPLAVDKRAGMITTQWFLMIHTMFSPLPRTTAAQAYRAYLGMDIAKSEGILPVDGEPQDIDHRGVAEPACAVCHSTLDPLSYAFSPYNGIGRLRTGGVSALERTGQFDAARVPWPDDSVLFNTAVPDLHAWAETAVASDAFRRNVAAMLWKASFGHGPGPLDRAEFEALWHALPDDSWSANRLLHRLVDTDAFGVP